MATRDEADRVVYEGRDLEAMSFARNYHRWIVDELRPFLGRRVAEVGAGSGNLSEMLLATGIERLLAVEPSDEMYPLLARRLADDPRAQARHGVFADVADDIVESMDSVVYVNVLEHVRHDAAELAMVRRALRPGGHVCIFVPALRWLYSRFDASIGHHRRYHRAPLRGLMEAAGFEVVRLRWFDSPGILPWLVWFRLMGRTLGAGEVGAYDRWVVPLVRAVETRIAPPIGKNLLAIGRKR